MNELDATIFSDNDGTNPYTPDNDSQFYLPLDILGAATDVHGQIEGQFLNDVFDYDSYGESNGIQVCGSGRDDCEQGSLVFSQDLRDLFANTYAFSDVGERIASAQECLDNLGGRVDLKRYISPQKRIDDPDIMGLKRCEGSK